MTEIPIVLATDNNYIVPTITAITSLLANKNAGTFYHICILDDKITDENKQFFNWPRHEGGYDVRFIPVNLGGLEKTDNRTTWAAAIYAKYFICDLLPEYDKCIWIDSDITVMRDLTEYYNIDISGRYLAGVKSPNTNYNVAAEKHPVLPRDKYLLKCINVGSLLLNLDELRKLGGGVYFLKETFAKINSLPPKTPVTEQDMFNYLLTDKIVYLPLKYNFMIENLNTPERPYFPFCYDKATIEEALNEPVIVHYTFKPWKFTNSNMLYAPPYKKYFKIWESYYKASPLGDKKLSRKRLGFFYRLWFCAKPVLKSFHFLRKIKRQIRKTENLPIQDFYY